MLIFRKLKLIDTILSSYIHRYITSLVLSLQSNKSKNLKTIYFINSINYNKSLKKIFQSNVLCKEKN